MAAVEQIQTLSATPDQGRAALRNGEGFDEVIPCLLFRKTFPHRLAHPCLRVFLNGEENKSIGQVYADRHDIDYRKAAPG